MPEAAPVIRILCMLASLLLLCCRGLQSQSAQSRVTTPLTAPWPLGCLRARRLQKICHALDRQISHIEHADMGLKHVPAARIALKTHSHAAGLRTLGQAQAVIAQHFVLAQDRKSVV